MSPLRVICIRVFFCFFVFKDLARKKERMSYEPKVKFGKARKFDTAKVTNRGDNH